MTTTLIVLAHPGPTSFNAQWAQASAKASPDAVLWSDLCAMGFDPVERAAHYGVDGPFDPLRVQSEAAEARNLPMDIQCEIAKIRAADRLIFHFPLWWFGPPAILKGWTDRCLAHGAMHTSTQRFDTGMCRGKEAIFCVTTGASAVESGPGGKEGDTRMHLWPLAYTLRYCGFTVKEPILFHGIHGFFEGQDKCDLEHRCTTVLNAQTDIIKSWDDLPNMAFNADSDFTKDGLLKPEAHSHSAFIQHLPNRKA